MKTKKKYVNFIDYIWKNQTKTTDITLQTNDIRAVPNAQPVYTVATLMDHDTIRNLGPGMRDVWFRYGTCSIEGGW